MAEEETLFSRWSRRKRRVAEEGRRAGAVEDMVPSEPETRRGDDLAEPESNEEEAALLERLGLPRPESLGPGDDFRKFMQPGVPAFLKKRALKVLWRSNPVLANLDGLNDYDDDFTSPELTQKVLATAYKVGRGILSDPVEPVEAVQPVEVSEGAAGPMTEEVPSEDAEPDTVEGEPVAVTVVTDPDEPVLRPRRMRFGDNT